MKEQLKEMGLTENEATVYLTLLNHGASPAGVITSKSGIHRRSVYDAIDRLIEKGLVGYIKNNNVKIYEAANPKQLLEIMKRKEDDVKNIMPQLEGIYNQTKEKKETLFYKGKEGIKNIFDDQINEKKEIMIIGASSQAYETLKYYLPHYERARVAKKIKVKILFDNTAKKQKFKIPLSEIRYLNNSSGPTAINIYSDRVALIIWTEKPYAILIKDSDVAESYKKYFEVMWGAAII